MRQQGRERQEGETQEEFVTGGRGCERKEGTNNGSEAWESGSGFYKVIIVDLGED